MKNDPSWNIQLVQLVERYPVIWNTKFPKYGNRAETEKAWISIANQLNESNELCVEKWQMFLRTLQKSWRCNSTYYLSSYMKFVFPYCTKPKKPNENLEELIEIDGLDDEIWDNDGSLYETSENEYKVIEFLGEDNENAQEHTHNVEGLKQQITSYALNSLGEKRPKKRKGNFEKSFDEYVNMKKQAKLEVVSDNADVKFFKSLLPDIARLDDSEKFKFKMTVLKILNNILHG